jgi:hypothetical protein
MGLRKEQSRFVFMVSQLIQFAYIEGYELTFATAYVARNCVCRVYTSFHRKRLAIDLNLFKDGVYQRSTEAHRPLGEYWESLGGTWGGRFKRKDGNHYSLGE